MQVTTYRCRCGMTFPAAAGKYGCPNCCGDSGAAKPTTRSTNMGTANSKHATIARIAKKHLGFETLKIRFSDRQDFREVYVDKLRDALEAAYEAGRAAEAKTWAVCK